MSSLCEDSSWLGTISFCLGPGTISPCSLLSITLANCFISHATFLLLTAPLPFWTSLYYTSQSSYLCSSLIPHIQCWWHPHSEATSTSVCLSITASSNSELLLCFISNYHYQGEKGVLCDVETSYWRLKDKGESLGLMRHGQPCRNMIGSKRSALQIP
jgi:hypothetical protein